MVDTEIITLPKSGYAVSFGKFFTVGQARELQKIMLGKSVFNTEKNQIEEASVESFLDMQAKAAEFLVVEIRDKSGNVLSVNKKEWFDGLPQSDGEILLNKARDVQKESGMSEESKKN